MKSDTISKISENRGIGTGVLGGLFAVLGIAGVVAAALDLHKLQEANLLVASGGAMALGLMLVATSLFVRLREAHEARLLDVELYLARKELDEALALSDELRRRFDAAQAKRQSVED